MKRSRKDEALILKLRALLAMEHDRSCPCPMMECEWHGRCYECIRLHRCFADRVPSCLQGIPASVGPKGSQKLTRAKQAKLINAYWDRMQAITIHAGRLAKGSRRRNLS